jgi:hypothetical protein
MPEIAESVISQEEDQNDEDEFNLRDVSLKHITDNNIPYIAND